MAGSYTNAGVGNGAANPFQTIERQSVGVTLKVTPQINEGNAVDVRLVQSASRPLSNDELKKHRNKRNTPEGKLDKNGRPLKFFRDLESDWIVKNDVPTLALKSPPKAD